MENSKKWAVLLETNLTLTKPRNRQTATALLEEHMRFIL